MCVLAKYAYILESDQSDWSFWKLYFQPDFFSWDPGSLKITVFYSVMPLVACYKMTPDNSYITECCSLDNFGETGNPKKMSWKRKNS